jgi:predicted RNA-binding Zn-ribbon protein involved in translation (DUF1610 family)
LENYVFDDCVDKVERFSGKDIPFWNDLANKYHYENKEAIRSDFRREAKRRHYSLTDARRESGAPKILILDLENTPMVGYFWSLWQQNLSTDNIIKDWNLLSYSAKWLFDEEVISEVLTPKEVEKQDDSRLTNSLWNLLDTANIAVAYNGISFDFKRCNTRFLKHGLKPPSYYVPVDPIVTAKKKFDISSNKMDYISEFIDGDRKIHTNFNLWVRCMNGEQDALDEMESYNKQDVIVLETIYLNFLPWMEGHPNFNVFYTDNISRCPQCGNENLTYSGKTYPTLTNLYEAYRCDTCGYSGRNHKGILSKDKRLSIVR